MFLINASDPGDVSKPPWWEIPGGGHRPRRVVRPCLCPGAVGGGRHPPGPHRAGDLDPARELHVRRLRLRPGRGHPRRAVRQQRDHPARRAGAVRGDGVPGARWWTLEELLANDEPTLPPRLRELLPPILEGDYPTRRCTSAICELVLVAPLLADHVQAMAHPGELDARTRLGVVGDIAVVDRDRSTVDRDRVRRELQVRVGAGVSTAVATSRQPARRNRLTKVGAGSSISPSRRAVERVGGGEPAVVGDLPAVDDDLVGALRRQTTR